MADALCGPSNALQSFQKHTSVDRTLQQDRLVGRLSPSQGFRSSPGPSGALDADFEAFQAGQALPLQQQQQQPHGFHHALPPPQLAHAQSQFIQPQATQAPDWASDFQRLDLAPTHAAPASWHQDFIQQQAATVQASPLQQQQQNGFSGMAYDTSGFAQPSFQHRLGYTGLNGNLSTNMHVASAIAQGKQRAQEAPQFDEAAFEQAFAQAQQDMVEGDTIGQTLSTAGPDILDEEVEEPALQRLREQRPGVYAALKIRSAVDTGRTADTQKYFDFMESLEQSSTLVQDASEGQWIAETLRKVADRGGSQESKTRAENLARAVNERLMSTYPLHSSPVPMGFSEMMKELEAAGYTRSPAPEQIIQEPESVEQKPQEEPPLPHDNDEMAETAGRLLERVADNKSSKFQNSQFLQLMRRLRDREVRVEGDKMVEVSETSSPSSAPLPQHTIPPQSIPSTSVTSETAPPAPTAIPPIDPNILNHAATDFSMPVSLPSDDNFEYASTADQANNELVTDEITGQYSHYNANGAYHR